MFDTGVKEEKVLENGGEAQDDGGEVNEGGHLQASRGGTLQEIAQ